MKILNFLIASLFLITFLSNVSAISVSYGEWAGTNTITQGNNAEFNYYFAHFFTPSMQINIRLYDSSNNLIYTLLETSTPSESYYNSNPIQITQSIYQNPGIYSLTFYSNDADNVPSITTIELIVNSPSTPTLTNHAPTITSTPKFSIYEGEYYEYQVTATDPENNTLNYSLTQAPIWLSINPVTRLISGVAPQVDSHTSNTVIVTVSDGTNFVSQSYTLIILNIIPDTTAPVIILNSPEQDFITDSEITFNATISDDVAIESVSLYIDGTLNQTDTSGLNNVDYLFTLDLEDGIYSWYIEACDTSGNCSESETRNLTIDTTAPLIDIISPIETKYSNKKIQVQVNITDLSLHTCWYRLNDNEDTFACVSGINNLEITAQSGENTLTIYANDSMGNEYSSSVTFTYKKSSSGGSAGGSGTITSSVVKESAESLGNITIKTTETPTKKSYDEFMSLFYFMIAITSLGIIIISYILIKKIQEMRK